MNRLGQIFCVAVWAAPLWAGPLSEDEPIQQETPTPSPVSTPPPARSPDEKPFTLSVAPLIGIPASGNTASEYNVGGGVEAFFTFRASPNLLVGFDLGVQDYTVNTGFIGRIFQQTYGFALPPGVSLSGDFTYVPAMLMLRYSFGDKKNLTPYGLFGLGPAFNKATVWVSYNNQGTQVTVSETDFVLATGFGLALRAGDKLEFFLQGRVDIDFTSNNNSDTITIGTPGPYGLTENGNLSDDSPTLFIPFQIGARFL